MSRVIRVSGLALMVGSIGLAGCRPSPAAGAQRPATTLQPVFSQTLPHMNGDHLKTIGVEVKYAPGAASAPHTHSCAVVGYVLEGAIRTQLKGESEAVYHAGQTFYEPPNGVHQVSANASIKEPARLLALFTCDHEAPLSVPVRDSAAGASR